MHHSLSTLYDQWRALKLDAFIHPSHLQLPCLTRDLGHPPLFNTHLKTNRMQGLSYTCGITMHGLVMILLREDCRQYTAYSHLRRTMTYKWRISIFLPLFSLFCILWLTHLIYSFIRDAREQNIVYTFG